jgi:hypothetical protein
VRHEDLFAIGRPFVDRWLWPVSGYTEIEPGQSATFNIVMGGGAPKRR